MKLLEYTRFAQAELFYPPAMSLDISDRSYHLVKIKRHFAEHPTIEYFSSGVIPPGIVEFGQIKKENELIGILQSAFSDLKTVAKNHGIAASLPEEKAFIKTIQIARTNTKEEMENAIRFEAETSIPLSAAEMYFDYEDVTPNTVMDHRDIEIIAYPRAIVDSYVRVLYEAGFSPLFLELESAAILRAIIDAKKENGAVLCIDIGRTKSGFIIYYENFVGFTSTLPIGGRDIERAIQEVLLVDAPRAEELKKTVGFSRSAADKKVYNALSPIVSAIIDEAEKDLKFFDSHPRHVHGEQKSVQKILLCGGDSYLIGLSQEIEKRTILPVEYGDPLQFYRQKVHGIKTMSQHEALLFSTALGTALRASRMGF